ncbi:MAG: alpha-mannosidase [Bacteroidales bacterium]|nr:alpha-mannosidase [Bacteroidales bacterium]
MRSFAPILGAALMLFVTSLSAQTNRDYDLTEDKVLYLVGYAHLDTEWRWDYPTTINEYLKNTLDDNFALFEKYPQYVFNFTGSRRYRLMREYYPDRYERLKKYIDRGRWHVSGSSVDEGDVNAPSPESVIRQVLYGNQYFREEFGKESVDYMLPDCFGFQAHLPSVWAHCGIKGFSTQKLKWGSAVGVPFNVGLWEGPDGNSVIMANSIRSYGGEVEPRVDTSSFFSRYLGKTGEKYGFYGGYSYYGVGDIGGAPREEDVRHMVNSLDHPDSDIQVIPASSDRMYQDITPAIRDSLPRYKGDFLLTEHSAASITSQAYMKRWNRKNEKLAQSAELLAVMADWTGALDYPFDKLNDSWELILGSQMHDIIPGTSIPSAYHYAWNDEVIAMNGLAQVEKNATGAFTRALDTDVKGQPVVVYNPVSQKRQDVVEATIPGEDYEDLAVYDPEGNRVPAQILSSGEGNTRLIFLATVSSAGYAVYDIREEETLDMYHHLRVTENSLENDYYRVTLNEHGDVASVYDKRLGRELLESPIRLAFLKANPRRWPAWNMSWRERIHEPTGYVEGDPEIRIIEKGPVRVSLEITRQSRGSTFRQTVSLARGKAGKRLMFDNKVVWKTQGTTLKALFPLTAHNFHARYNLGLGTIERPSNHSRQYEVPSREWIDLTDTSGTFGVSILEDCKFGSDKPDGNTIRLTLLHTPVAHTYFDQATQDFGTHRFTYALYGHPGNWNQGNTEWRGLAVNQPMQAFTVPKHPGQLGRSFSFARLSSDEVAIRAVKKAEDGESYIIRLQELSGNPTRDVTLDLGPPIRQASEVDGQERMIRELDVPNGNLELDMKGYAIRSISVKLRNYPGNLSQPDYQTLKIPYNVDVFSGDDNRSDGSIGDSSGTYPAEMIPSTIVSDDVAFSLGSGAVGEMNALECRGQQLDLPEGNHNTLYLLAAAKKETNGRFELGSAGKELSIQPWTGFVGQWDKRVFRTPEQREVKKVQPGYIRRDPIAWYCSHHHTPDKNVAYEYSYIYRYALDIPSGASTLKLPDNPDILVFAATAARNPNDAAGALSPLYDDLSNREGFKVKEESWPGKDLQPQAQLSVQRLHNRDEIFSQISREDYANLTSLNGVTMTYYPEGEAYTRAAVGAEKILLQDLFDGSGKTRKTFDEVIWYDNGQGRYVMDLQQSLAMDSLSFTSPVFTLYGIPIYTVWGTNDPGPTVKGDPAVNGWTYLGAHRKSEGVLWSDAWSRTTMTFPDGANQYRHIMWIADKNWHGTHYFFEVDVFEEK